MDGASLYTSASPSPTSNGWVFRGFLYLYFGKNVKEFDPPIEAQHVGLMSISNKGLPLAEVEVYGKEGT